jgi:hypothetical protein
MVPGCAGAAEMVTARVEAVELPHALFAVTVTLPPVAPAVVVMLFVVLVPDQPLGNVQV